MPRLRDRGIDRSYFLYNRTERTYSVEIAGTNTEVSTPHCPTDRGDNKLEGSDIAVGTAEFRRRSIQKGEAASGGRAPQLADTGDSTHGALSSSGQTVR